MTDQLERRERGWRRKTQMVRGGTRRSAWGETSEALFLTSGFVYDTPEIAAARHWSRSGPSTKVVSMP